MKSHQERYNEAVARFRATKNRAHPTRGPAAELYADWAWEWWQIIQRAFPGYA